MTKRLSTDAILARIVYGFIHLTSFTFGIITGIAATSPILFMVMSLQSTTESTLFFFLIVCTFIAMPISMIVYNAMVSVTLKAILHKKREG